jgi:hypothetical protein
MRTTSLAAAFLLALAGLANLGAAAGLDDTYHKIKRGYHRNEAWPWPYVCADRVAVREPFCIMINNGWRRQNLLGPHHFNATADQLTTAGELRVQWILTQAPPERRGIFVERDLDPSVTEQRLAAVRDYATKLNLAGQPAVVTDTHLVSEGRPASVVDATNVRFYENIRPPMLPVSASPSAGAAAAQ